jgi:enediyne polyketide synthase
MSQGIAIIGLGCRYPDATGPEQLWENVVASRRAFRRLPSERLSADDYLSSDRSQVDRTYVTQAAVIEGYEFDRLKYRVAGSTYRSADLAHWLALDVAASALADAGFEDANNLPRETTGVILGNSLTGEFSRSNLMRLRWPYVRRVVQSALTESGWNEDDLGAFLRQLERSYKQPFPEPDSETLAGGLSNTIAGRICNHFDLNGGGFTVDGACSASLLAVTQACAQLITGDLDVALAGGVDVSLDPFELVGFARVGALAADEMRVYDRRSAGFWPGEGCGFIVLMREEDARQQGREIHAIIRGWGISSDGSGGITRPEAAGQALALQRAYRRAQMGVDEVGYFEGHGTGTTVGDATELQVLSDARKQSGAAHCAAIGSIKANIGHTKAAAGIAGLLKATLAVRHRTLPPTTGCELPHDTLTTQDPALRVLGSAEPWPADVRHVAGVSAMGFGGINTHVVIEGHEAPSRRSAPRLDVGRSAQDAELFLFSAADGKALSTRLSAVADKAAALSRSDMTDLAAALVEDLDDQPWRTAVVASTPQQLVDGLQQITDWITAGTVTRFEDGLSLNGSGQAGRIGLLMPGQASPARADGGAWARRVPAIESLYSEAKLVAPTDGDHTATEFAQPAITTATAAGLAALDHLGIEAVGTVGHSLGELSALHWAGAFDAAALVRIARARGQAMADLGSSDGAMAGICADTTTVQTLINGHDVQITGYNGPRQTVVSGRDADIETVVADAVAAGLPATRLPVSHAFHSPHVAAAIPSLKNQLASETLSPLSGNVYSTITAQALTAQCDTSELLCEQITAPVRFEEALTALAEQVDLLIEAGPGQVLNGLASDIVDVPIVSMDAGSTSIRGLLLAAGAAHVIGLLKEPRRLFDHRLVRPFDLDRPMQFFANPCEQAPDVAGLDFEDDAESPDEAIVVDHAAGPLELFTRLVAARVELPPEAVAPDNKLLGDLHLNSITVGELVTAAARQLDLPAPASPTIYATATVAEVADALEALIGTQSETTDKPTALPAGVDTWIAAFTATRAPRPLHERPVDLPVGQWQVFGKEDDALVGALRSAFADGPHGSGVVLCLPDTPDAPASNVLLDAIRAVLAMDDAPRFVLVQRSLGHASLAKTLHLEHPQIPVCAITLPGGEDSRHAEWVVREAAQVTRFVEVLYDRDGIRYGAVLKRRRAAVACDWPLGPEDVLLVSGGGKGIGFECARAAAQDSGVRLGLIGRADPEHDPELAGNLAELVRLEIPFVYAPADVTDAHSVQAAVQHVRDELGAVTALWHAAGINPPELLATLSEETFDRTLAPKVDGFEHVLAALDPAALRQLVSFGSLIGRLGLVGEAHYAVANERLSTRTRMWGAMHSHCRAVAMEWSVWESVGMGQKLGRIEALLQEGITPIPTARGIGWLKRILASSDKDETVLVSGRFGAPSTMPPAGDLPLWRFCEQPRVHIPGVELIIDSEMTRQSDPYLAEHMLQGELLLPAVVGLESMAQITMALCGSDVPPIFEDVHFDRPVVIPGDAALTLRIAAVRRDDDTIEVVLRTSTTSFQIDHFRARCRFDDRPADAPAHDWPSIEGSRIKLDPAADLYDRILFHTGRFRRLDGYRHLRAHACVADIAARENGQWYSPYLPGERVLGDAAARDTAIHGIQSCIPHARLLPIGVQRIETSALPGEACIMRAVEVGRDEHTLTYDMEICDHAGRPLERWHGLSLRMVESLPPSPAWRTALLGPYVEWRFEEVSRRRGLTVALERNGTIDRRIRSDRAIRTACGTQGQVKRAPNGRPEPIGDRTVSVSHADDLTLAVAAPTEVGCDIEAVAQRSRTAWQDLLGTDRTALAEVIDREHPSDFDTSATRVWAAHECLRKVQAALDAPLSFAGTAPDGWVMLRSGDKMVGTYATAVHALAQPLVLAILIGDAPHV